MRPNGLEIAFYKTLLLSALLDLSREELSSLDETYIDLLFDDESILLDFNEISAEDEIEVVEEPKKISNDKKVWN